MIITTKIENLCDKNRPSISNPFLDDDGNLIATNGKAMAVIPKMNNADDVPGYVPSEAIKNSRVKRKNHPNWNIRLNGMACVETPNGNIEFSRSDSEIQPPNYNPAIGSLPINKKDRFTIKFSVDLLDTLRKALGSDEFVTVTFDTRDNERPFFVTTKENGFGVMMPARNNR